MYRLIRGVIHQPNAYRFSTTKKESSGINLEEIPKTDYTPRGDRYHSSTPKDSSLEGSIIYPDFWKITPQKRFPKRRQREDDEDNEDNYENQDMESQDDQLFDSHEQFEDSSEELAYNEAYYEYLKKLEEHGLNRDKFDSDTFYQPFTKEGPKELLPYIPEIAEELDQDQTQEMQFDEFRQQIPHLEKDRAPKRSNVDLSKLEMLGSPYHKKTPQQIEKLKHGQGVHKGQISFFLNPTTQSQKTKKEKKAARNAFELQNEKYLLNNLNSNRDQQHTLLAEFVERFRKRLGNYTNALRQGFRIGMTTTNKISSFKNIIQSLNHVQQVIEADKFYELTDMLFQTLLTDLDENYSELTVQKIKLFMPLIDLKTYFSRLVSILAKYQNTTLLPELVSEHRQLVANAQIPNKDFNKMLVSCFASEPVEKLVKILLKRNRDADYESLRAEIMRQKLLGRKIFPATEEELERAYSIVVKQPRHFYALYSLLEIAQLNQHHQIVIFAHQKQLRQHPDNVNPTIQRLYHDSLLMLPIINLQEIVIELIKKEDFSLVFSLKGLVRAGFYQQAWNIFKQKVLDEVAPKVMSERIRTFFRIIYDDYNRNSGQDISALLKQSETFAQTMKQHENYMIDLYNKENVYDRRVDGRRQYFKTLFEQHQLLKRIRFTEEQAEMLYVLISNRLDMIYWDIEMPDSILDEQFEYAINGCVRDFTPIKEYMDSVSDYQMKKEWELYLMQLNIYVEQLRTKLDFVSNEEFDEFEGRANEMIRFVLNRYRLYPLADSQYLNPDEMLIAIDEVRMNNYWIRKPNFIDRRIMDSTDFLKYHAKKFHQENSLEKERRKVGQRLDEYDDLDVSHVFNNQVIEMREGEYEKIESIKSVIADPERLSSILSGEYQQKGTQAEVDPNYAYEQNQEVAYAEGVQNAQSHETMQEAENQEAAAQQVQQASPQGAQDNVEQQYEEPQNQQEIRFNQAVQIQKQKWQRNHKLQLERKSHFQLQYLGTLLKQSSHYKQMIEDVRRPTVQLEVQNAIEVRNYFGEGADMLYQEQPTEHARRFHHQDQSYEELAMYETKVDLGILKPELYQEIKKTVEETYIQTSLATNQDLEHINDMPDRSSEFEQLENDLINYRIQFEPLERRIRKKNGVIGTDTEEELMGLTSPPKPVGRGIPEEQREVEVQAENLEEVGQEQVPQQVEEVEEQAQEPAVEDPAAQQIVLEGGYYQSQLNEDQKRAALSPESITDMNHTLRLDYFRMSKVYRIWNNPLAKKHQLVVSFADGLTRNTHVITIEYFERLKNQFPEIWNEAENIINIKPDPLVDELISWGINNSEPMAIYMGEKLAMLTRQIIPDHLAEGASAMLDLHADTEEHIKQKSEMALNCVGRIERAKIYNFNNCYKHILHNRQFEQYVNHLDKIYDFQNKDTIQRLQSKDIRQFAPGKISDATAWKRLQYRALKKQCDYI